MFVRVKKIGAYEYLYLVENAREGGRHVQRVIKALGRREEVEASGLIDGLIASAARHSRRSIVLSSFYRGELPELHRHSIGPDLVFGRLWAETGCRDVLRSLLAERRFSFDVERAVYLTVLHRLMISGSDRHASEWRNGLRVPGADGLDLDHAYKAMAWLGAVDEAGRSMAEAVEEALYRHRQPLFGAVSIAFFDTTSLWFEGAGGESLGQHGHSKDYRDPRPARYRGTDQGSRCGDAFGVGTLGRHDLAGRPHGTDRIRRYCRIRARTDPSAHRRRAAPRHGRAACASAGQLGPSLLGRPPAAVQKRASGWKSRGFFCSQSGGEVKLL
jgi:hypothetical protein